MENKEEEYSKVFKLMGLETEEKRKKYQDYSSFHDADEDKKEVTFIRTGYDTQALGEAGDAELESDS